MSHIISRTQARLFCLPFLSTEQEGRVVLLRLDLGDEDGPVPQIDAFVRRHARYPGNMPGQIQVGPLDQIWKGLINWTTRNTRGPNTGIRNWETLANWTLLPRAHLGICF